MDSSKFITTTLAIIFNKESQVQSLIISKNDSSLCKSMQEVHRKYLQTKIPYRHKIRYVSINIYIQVERDQIHRVMNITYILSTSLKHEIELHVTELVPRAPTENCD